MNYDDILEELGQFSRWHFVATFPLFLTMATAALGILSFSFTGNRTKQLFVHNAMKEI